MPNWCSSSYVSIGNQQNVENLFNEFKKVLEADRNEFVDEKYSFLPNPSWLGYLVSDLLGIDPESEEVKCRGTITSVDDEVVIDKEGQAHFSFSTETAWADCRKLFYLIAEKFDVEILFFTEELGSEILETNDEEGRFFSERYLLDEFDSDMTYYDTFEQLSDAIQELSDVRPTCYDEIDDILDDHGLAEDMNVHEVSLVSIHDY